MSSSSLSFMRCLRLYMLQHYYFLPSVSRIPRGLEKIRRKLLLLLLPLPKRLCFHRRSLVSLFATKLLDKITQKLLNRFLQNSVESWYLVLITPSNCNQQLQKTILCCVITFVLSCQKFKVLKKYSEYKNSSSYCVLNVI